MQEVHPIDVAHCIFAVSLSGGAAATLNLGQRKFHFDLGGLFESAAADMSKSGSVRSALSLAGSVADTLASQGLNQRSLAGSLSVVNWRMSVGGRSARSQRSFCGAASEFGAGQGQRGCDDVDFGFPSNTGSADTFASCESRMIRAGGSTSTHAADCVEQEDEDLQAEGHTVSLARGIADSNPQRPLGYLDRQFWRVLSINDGSELHDAVSGSGERAPAVESEQVGILKWLGWV